MNELEYISLVKLANHYRITHAEFVEELARRDDLSKMTYDELMALYFEESDNAKPDNQLAFDFDLDLDSAQEVTNNKSVQSDPWEEGYEVGRKVGFEQGRSDETIS